MASEPPQPPGQRRLGSDGYEYALQSRMLAGLARAGRISEVRHVELERTLAQGSGERVVNRDCRSSMSGGPGDGFDIGYL